MYRLSFFVFLLCQAELDHVSVAKVTMDDLVSTPGSASDRQTTLSTHLAIPDAESESSAQISPNRPPLTEHRLLRGHQPRDVSRGKEAEPETGPGETPTKSLPDVSITLPKKQDLLYPIRRDPSKHGLYLMGFGAIDIENEGGWSSAGVIPALQMAIDDVNAREDILPEYELVMDMKDSKVT